LQIFLGKEHLVKKLADLHPRQDNLLQRNNFSAVYKTSLYILHIIGWRPAEKTPPFFQHACSRSNISIVLPIAIKTLLEIPHKSRIKIVQIKKPVVLFENTAM
jgi:hypothetical protein